MELFGRKLFLAAALILSMCAALSAQKASAERTLAMAAQLQGADDRGADHYVLTAGTYVTFELRLAEPAKQLAIAMSVAVEHGVLDAATARLIHVKSDVAAGIYKFTAMVPAELAGQAFVLQARAYGRSGKIYDSAAMTLMIIAAPKADLPPSGGEPSAIETDVMVAADRPADQEIAIE